jgi:hypothetical protein
LLRPQWLLIALPLFGCGDRSPPALWPEPPPPTLAHPIGVDIDAQTKKPAEPDAAEPLNPDLEPPEPEPEQVEPPADPPPPAPEESDAKAPAKPKRKPAE